MRWVIRLAGVLVGLLVLFLVALVMVPREQVAQLAAREFEASTGRALTIAGEVRPSVWPRLGVRTGPVTVANAPWSREGPMLEAASLEIGLDTVALMTGVWRISRIALEAPVLRLERAADGRANWDMRDERPAGAAAGTGAEGPAAPPAERGLGTFTLDEGVLRGGRLLWIDHGAGSRVEIESLDLTAHLPEAAGRADVTLSGRAGGRAFALEGTVEEADRFLAGRVVPLRASLVAGAARLGFEGQLGTAPMVADGRIDAALGDLSDLMALMERPKPDLPEGLGRREVGVAGRITLAEGGSLHLREALLRLDANRLRVDADLQPGSERPKIDANLRAEALDLSSLAPARETPRSARRAGAAPAPAPAPEGWSKAPIDLGALSLADANLALSLGSLDLGRLRFGATKAILTLDRARAVFDLREVAAYGGQVTGQLVLNGRSGVSAGADLTLSGLATEPLLADLAGYDRLATTGDVRLKLIASGGSLDALVRDLSGTGSARFGKGEMRGLDVARMVRTFDAGNVGDDRTTVFDSLSASFTVEGGVLRNEDLALAAPLLRATGAGRVGLGDRTLDYRLLPMLLPREDGTGGVSVPLLIAGPWAALRYRLDMEALVRQPVERQVKERLTEEAAERLGVVPEEGESLEDAAKRRAREALEKEAARALGRMLGGN